MTETVSATRATERRKLEFAARLRSAGRIAICEVVNLSETGCKLKAAANFLEVGDNVSIKPDTLEPLTGTVRWKEDGCIGVEFHSPMYGPVVDHLAIIHVPKGSRGLV